MGTLWEGVVFCERRRARRDGSERARKRAESRGEEGRWLFTWWMGRSIANVDVEERRKRRERREREEAILGSWSDGDWALDRWCIYRGLRSEKFAYDTVKSDERSVK